MMRKKEFLIITVIIVVILAVIIIMSISNDNTNNEIIKHPMEYEYSFTIDKSLELNSNNLSDIAHATVKLYDSDDKDYYLYLNIENNEFIDKDATIILTITDPIGELITNIDNLTYNESLNGFDITNCIGNYELVSNYLITSNTTQEWEFSVRLINAEDVTESFKASIEFSDK